MLSQGSEIVCAMSVLYCFSTLYYNELPLAVEGDISIVPADAELSQLGQQVGAVSKAHAVSGL